MVVQESGVSGGGGGGQAVAPAGGDAGATRCNIMPAGKSSGRQVCSRARGRAFLVLTCRTHTVGHVCDAVAPILSYQDALILLCVHCCASCNKVTGSRE